MRVLIIDDDEHVLRLARFALRGQAEVTTAKSGAEGLSAATRQPFDVVLLDMVMPEEDGMAVLASVVSHK